jgi:hypothetical protein
MSSGQWQVYKQTGALQARLIPCNPNGKTKDGKTTFRSGSVYLEAATCIDKENKVYDWDNKVKFALGLADLQKILVSRDATFDLFHIPDGNKAPKGTPGKKMSVKVGEGNYASTRMFSFMDSATGNKANIPLSGEEWNAFLILCEVSLPMIIGWGMSYNTQE